MPFTIPNEVIAFNGNQAEIDSIDLDILVAAWDGSGTISGGAVTAQGIPDMTVAVASGVGIIAGTRVTIGAGNVTITAADGSNPRFDLVVINSSAVKSVTAGTPAAEPVFPAIPANSIVLAAVYVPTSDTTIEDNQIIDKRVIVNNIASPAFGNTNTWIANQTFNDNIQLNFGTGSDWNITFDGTDLNLTGTGLVEFQQAQTISTSTGDLTLNPADSLNVTLTDDDADAFDLANSAASYYLIDTRNTVGVDIFAHTFDTEDFTVASAANSRPGIANFATHTVNYTGTTQVTAQFRTVQFDASVLVGDSALTIDSATTILAVAPTESTNITLTDASALRIQNASGTPTNQYGIYIEALTSGVTADYGIYFGGASGTAEIGSATDVKIGVLDGSAVHIIEGTASGNTITTGTVLMIDSDNDPSYIEFSQGSALAAGIIWSDTTQARGRFLYDHASNRFELWHDGVEAWRIGNGYIESLVSGQTFRNQVAGETLNWTVTEAASTISTVTSGALTLTSADAATWSVTSGLLTLSATDISIPTSVGLLIGGYGSPITVFGQTDGGSNGAPETQLVGAASPSGNMLLATFHTNDAYRSNITFLKSGSLTVGTGVTAVADNEAVGDIQWGAADGIDLLTLGARISAQVDGTVATGQTPMELIFATSATGESSISNRWKIRGTGEFEAVGAQSISNTSGDLTLNPAASLNVTLTDDDGDSLTFANSASNYYNISTINTVTGTTVHSFDTEDATFASTASAAFRMARFEAYTLTLTGTTQVTGLVSNVVFASPTITDVSAVIVDLAVNIQAVAPTEAGSVVITDAAAIYVHDTGGTPVNQHGIYMETLTVGATADYMLTLGSTDVDHNLIHVGVTGDPLFFWDESEDAFSFDKGLVMAGAVGIDFNPGSDIDTDILTVGVTGAPTVFWDESQNQISLNVGLDITAGTVTFDQVTHGVAGTTETIDWSAGQKHHLTLDENLTISFTDPAGPCNLLVVLEQDATATNTVTWPAAVEWPGGTEPTQSAGANEKDIYSFYYDGSIYHGVQTALFS